MKKLHVNPILIWFILSCSLTIINCIPCPSECLCKPTSTVEEDFTRLNYLIDCQNVPLKDSQLLYQASPWSVAVDKIADDDDMDSTNDYVISIDLSNSSLKRFNNQTIQLTGFPFEIQSLSLSSQPKDFSLQSNAFASSLYQRLEVLNLSSCCQQIPEQCSQLFQPLKNLQVLDLSASDMFTSCLNASDAMSSKLRDLILRNNNYDTTTFSHSSLLFDGVRTISGKLDLQYSRFNMGTQLKGNCLLDIFTEIKILDLSFVKFYSTENNQTEVHLKHLLECKSRANVLRRGDQLNSLYLRGLNLRELPQWFTNDTFPQLTQLDLSSNHIRSIDFQDFLTLTSVSLAYNPIDYKDIKWRPDKTYESINLRSIGKSQTTDLSNRLETLFKVSIGLDYSENTLYNVTKFPVDRDFQQISLNISQTNIYSFDVQDIRAFDDLYQLDISSNYLTELDLQKQEKLAYLDCSNQQLKTLLLDNEYSQLVQLKCSNNSLTTVGNFVVLKHEKLQLIDLSFNFIVSLEKLFLNLNSPYLQTIELQSNMIERVRAKIFHEKLISLYSINLSWNKINFIDKFAFQAPNLQILDLTGNPLKSLQPNFLFTSSLRLFYIVNHTQQLVDRCAQSKSNDNLLLTYITWFEQNGTYMRSTQSERSEQIQFDKCLLRYTSRSKVKWMKFNDKYHFKHLSLYITLAAISVGIVLGVIYLYKKNKLNLPTQLRRYRPLDRDNLVDNTDEMNYDQREDDQIVMNLAEPPFNNINRS